MFGKYPLSNACGQGRYAGLSLASYQDSNLYTKEEAFMVCPVNSATVDFGSTKGVFDGAPLPLETQPRASMGKFTGTWDSSLFDTDTQIMGKNDPLSALSANSMSDD